MEIWDLYYKDGRPAGIDLVRGEPVPEGLFFIFSDTIVKHVDGTYLLMQRDWSKPGFPGRFEMGAGGAAQKGETPYENAVRELKEETGIEAKDLTLVFMQRTRGNAFCYGFTCMTDCAKDSIVLQKGETIAYRWVNRQELLDFLETDQCVSSQRERWKPYMEMV